MFVTPTFVYIGISTHSLTRRLTDTMNLSLWTVRYFNSQPHKEADLIFLAKSLSIPISTHSLTRRLTSVSLPGFVSVYISTHSLTRRLTLLKAW